MFSSRNVIRRCFSRKFLSNSFSSLSRPIAKFEQFVEDGDSQTSATSKQKQHPGIVNHSSVILPERLKEAVDKILNSSSDANLLQNAKILKYHLAFKKPPLTENQLKEIESSCATKLVTTHPLLFGE